MAEQHPIRIQRISKKNATWQKFEVLQTNRNKRYRYRQFLVEGVRNINEAVSNNWTIDAWIYPEALQLSGWARQLLAKVLAPVHYVLSSELMAELSGKTEASELCALVRMRDDAAQDSQCETHTETPLLALFDRPSNKGNLGTLIRTCDALGVDRLVLTGHGVDRYEPDVIVASMGSFFRLPVFFIPQHDAIRQWIDRCRCDFPDLQVVGTTAHQATPIDKLTLSGPVLFMIGNETDGLSRWLCEQCTDMATIPMVPDSAASSLNVACAATVLFYEARRQRASGPERFQ